MSKSKSSQESFMQYCDNCEDRCCDAESEK